MKIGEYEINQIYNEDSYEAIKKLPDKCLDLIIIDPPYELETHGGGHSPLAKQIQEQHKELYESDLHIGIDNVILEQMCDKMKSINICVFCNKKQLIQYLNFFNDKGCLFDIITWHKQNAIPNYSCKYMSDTEYCLVFRKGKPMNKDSENYEDRKTWWVEPINITDKNLYDHPTIKPLELVKKMIRNHSEEGDLVADFFLGSGTTCVGAKKLGRNYIGFEIDKDFYKIAQDRLNGITQIDRKKKDEGQLSIDDFI
jgi:DNA modification methylase